MLATYAKDFYSGKAAITLNTFGLGKAVYIGTMCQQNFTTTSWSGCGSSAISIRC